MPETKKQPPRLKNLDDLFMLYGGDDDTGEDDVRPLRRKTANTDFAVILFELMDDFPNHPFKLYDGERESDMVESIRVNGILQPFILRATGDSRYQILSGHNRKYAGIKAGLAEGSAVIKRNLTDDEAWVYVIETNLMQRSFADMAHSEKAAVIAMQHSKLFSQGKRNDILKELKMIENPHEHKAGETSGQLVQKIDSRESVAREYSLSGRTIARYQRVNTLIAPIKTRLDNEDIAFIPAVTLSFLKESEQLLLDKCMELNSFKVDMKKADILRRYSEKSKLDEENIYLILSGEIGQKPKPNRTPTVKVNKTVYARYFKPSQSAKEIQGIVEKALEMYFTHEKSNEALNDEQI
jgi:ParB family chromosome partitioning protein